MITTEEVKSNQPLITQNPHKITLLRGRIEPRKVVTKHEDGTFTSDLVREPKSKKPAGTFAAVTKSFADLDGLVKVLEDNVDERTALVHGKPAPDASKARMRRNSETLVELPHPFLILDVDRLEGPADPREAALKVREALPEPSERPASHTSPRRPTPPSPARCVCTLSSGWIARSQSPKQNLGPRTPSFLSTR